MLAGMWAASQDVHQSQHSSPQPSSTLLTCLLLSAAGGSESCVDPVSITGFSRMRALSTSRLAQPQTASRPFDASR